jgi:hypothetical protein
MATATMVFSEPKVPLLWDVSATLLDLELAYDFSVILTEPEYSTYKFSRFFWYRNRSRISEGYRLRATSIELHSPLLLEVVVPSIAGLAGLLQIFQAISNWPLSREKLELEVNKLRREEAEHRLKVSTDYSAQIHKLAASRDADDFDRKISERLSRSKLQLTHVDVELDDG